MSDLFSLESTALPLGTRVVAYEGREALSETYLYRLWLLVPASGAADVDINAAMLADARFAQHREDGSLRRQVHGVLSSLELLDEHPGGDALYVAEVVPNFWRLRLSRHSRVWVDRTLPQIVRDVCREAGLEGARWSDRLTASRYQPIDHVCQYRESDFDFLSRWFEREGIYYFFEQGDAGETLVLIDTIAAQREADDPVVRWREETADGSSGGEGARYFRRAIAARAMRVALTDHDPLRPTRVPHGEGDIDARGGGELRRHFEDNFVNDAQGRRLAGLRAEAELAERERLQCEGRIYGVVPGQRFALAGHPANAHNRDYQCVALETRGRTFVGDHEFSRWLPSGRERDRQTDWCVLSMTPDGVQFRAPMAAPRPHVAGVTVGFVDGPGDSDYAQLDEHGRYLVTLHLDENGGPDGTHSTRVRMMQPHAGAPEGWHLPLRKGTEVLVGFIGGDPDRPVITAAVPNADTPSVVTEMNHTQNVLHTGGDSRLEEEDLAGAQYIDLSTPPERTFMHLGKHHGAHQHNYITSTDGNGLIRTGGDYNVTVGGEKYEHVHGAVREDYDQTKFTEVTDAVTETYHADHLVAVSAHCQENYNDTQTTEVQNHTEETCAEQETHVRGELSERHGSQTTVVGGDWSTECASELFDTGPSTQRDGTLNWTIGNGALIKAGSVTITGPRFSMASRTTRTINRPNETIVDKEQHHLTAVKVEVGLLQLKFNIMALSHVIAKVDILSGLGVEVAATKVEDTVLKVSGGATSSEFVADETELEPLCIICLGMGVLL